MVGKDLLVELFQAAEMRRWNDKLCPVPLTELDKQGHKMTIAYVLGKFAENSSDFSWIEVIEGGLFEYFQRLTLTDIKPQIFREIKSNKGALDALNKLVLARFKPLIAGLNGLDDRFEDYLLHPQVTSSRKVLEAAHFYSTKWEFDIMEDANKNDYEIDEIRRDLQERQEALYEVEGLRKLILFPKYRSFVDLCGRLRFQIRWSQLYRVPRTTVLGHMLIVATLSYLFSLEIRACPKRSVNNYFAGLLHDLPETLTKDIIRPVKTATTGVEHFIEELEKNEMERRIYGPGLIPEEWYPELKMFTEDYDVSKVTVEGQLTHTSSDEITAKYNDTVYNPVDGEIVKAADDLAAFMEAYLAGENGISNPHLEDAVSKTKELYEKRTIAGLRFGDIYNHFS